MKSLNGVAVAAAWSALAAGGAAHAQEAVQWRVEDGGNGHWYRIGVTPDLLQWSVARTIAISNGGDLASLETPEEQTFCFESFSPATTPNAWRPQAPGSNALMGPWIGATQDVDGDEPIGGWRWLSGTRLNPAGPYCCNDDCGDADENRLHFYRLPNGSVGWNDLPDDPSPCVVGDAVISLLIEFSADCNGDGIVDYGQCRDGSLPDYNGNNIPDCCEQGVPCEVGNYPVQWRAEDGGNGHWYGNIGQGGCWSERRTQAAAIGGHLATVSDAEELSLIESLVPRSFYLGGYRIVPVPEGDPQDGWRWITDEPVPMQLRCITNFPISEQWLSGTAGLGCVGESDECSPYHYLIEWSADCNGDGIVDYGQIVDGTFEDANGNGVPDTCECFADVNQDGVVNGADISAVLGFWGQAGKPLPAADITRDGLVDGADIAVLLGSWGPCQ